MNSQEKTYTISTNSLRDFTKEDVCNRLAASSIYKDFPDVNFIITDDDTLSSVRNINDRDLDAIVSMLSKILC